MRKIAALFFIFSLVTGGCSNKQEEKLKEEVLLPKGYRGCAYVVYDIEGAPQLEIKDNTITYKLNEEGILATSSPETFGWVDEKASPNIDRHYYYVDENGKKEEVALEGIQHGVTVLAQ